MKYPQPDKELNEKTIWQESFLFSVRKAHFFVSELICVTD